MKKASAITNRIFALFTALVMGCGLSATGEVIALTVFPSDAEASPVCLVARTGQDINRVWVISGVSGSPVQTLLSNDLTAVAAWGTQYSATLLLDLVPTAKPNYYFQYEQRTIPASAVITLTTNSFTVGRNYSTLSNDHFYQGDLRFSDVTGSGTWDLLRETMFIFDRDASSRYRWEQVYRGPNGQLYVFRYLTDPKLMLLNDMVAQGYGVYNLSDFVNAPSIPPKPKPFIIRKDALQPLPLNPVPSRRVLPTAP